MAIFYRQTGPWAPRLLQVIGVINGCKPTGTHRWIILLADRKPYLHRWASCYCLPTVSWVPSSLVTFKRRKDSGWIVCVGAYQSNLNGRKVDHCCKMMKQLFLTLLAVLIWGLGVIVLISCLSNLSVGFMYYQETDSPSWWCHSQETFSIIHIQYWYWKGACGIWGGVWQFFSSDWMMVPQCCCGHWKDWSQRYG